MSLTSLLVKRYKNVTRTHSQRKVLNSELPYPPMFRGWIRSWQTAGRTASAEARPALGTAQFERYYNFLPLPISV